MIPAVDCANPETAGQIEAFLIEVIPEAHIANGMTKLLAAIAEGSVELWWVRDNDTGDRAGILATKVAFSALTGRNVLFIMGLKSFGGVGLDAWCELFSKDITRYARMAGCSFVEFVADAPVMMELGRKIGGGEYSLFIKEL